MSEKCLVFHHGAHAYLEGRVPEVLIFHSRADPGGIARLESQHGTERCFVFLTTEGCEPGTRIK